MTRYLISDLHLGYENIIEYCHRPFETVEEMNDAIIENWNATVDNNNNDIVVFLDDLGRFADDEQLRRWLDRLNGRIVFIEGNHDSPRRYTDGVRTHQYYILSQGERDFCCSTVPRTYHDSGKVGLCTDTITTTIRQVAVSRPRLQTCKRGCRTARIRTPV